MFSSFGCYALKAKPPPFWSFKGAFVHLKMIVSLSFLFAGLLIMIFVGFQTVWGVFLT